MKTEELKQWADDIGKAYEILAWGHSERAAEVLKNTKASIYKSLAQANQPSCNLAPDGVCETLDCPNHPPKLQPSQRTWVGLTDEDTFEIAERLGLSDIAWVDLMQAIEAKLKEKNT